jgi:hypothetical protein
MGVPSTFLFRKYVAACVRSSNPGGPSDPGRFKTIWRINRVKRARITATTTSLWREIMSSDKHSKNGPFAPVIKETGEEKKDPVQCNVDRLYMYDIVRVLLHEI